MSVPIRVLGVALAVYLLLALVLGSFLVTGLDGVYDFFSLKCVMISDNLLDGEVSPVVKRGTLAVFSPDTEFSSGDVVVATVADDLVVGRIIATPSGTYLGYDNSSSYYSPTEFSVEGTLDFSSGFLYDLIAFSLEFYGVLVLFALPVILNVAYLIFALKKKFRSAS